VNKKKGERSCLRERRCKRDERIAVGASEGGEEREIEKWR
jgi:hypothetical protein